MPKDQSVHIPGYPGLWRKTKAYGLWERQKLNKNNRKNADRYVASCIFILRYQEERTGMSPNWDSLFARVSSSRRTFTPRLFWRQDLSKLDRRAYRILEAILIHEASFKSIVPKRHNQLNDQEKNRADELYRHRRGKRMFVVALEVFHRMLTSESFWVKLAHDPARASTQAHAHVHRPNGPQKISP